MPQANPEKHDFERFFRESQDSFKRLPEQPAQSSDVSTRSAVFGIGAGLINYLATRQIPNLDRSGLRDEVSALLAAAAGAFIGSLRNPRTLCATEPEKRAQSKFNVVAAGAGGAVGGASIAAIIPATALATLGLPLVAALGAVVLGAAGLASGATALYNKAKRGKYCPHDDCQKRGNCKQRVCRSCKRLFFPEAVEINCSRNLFLDWYTIASYLHQQKLSYLDAEFLVKDHLGAWKTYPDNEGINITVDCDSFILWVRENKSTIASYKGSGMKHFSQAQAEEYLNKKGL
jgi:hypothetical protein